MYNLSCVALFSSVVHVLQLLPIRFTQQSVVLHLQLHDENIDIIRYENWTSPDLVMVI